MGTTTNKGWVYPDKGKKPYYTTIASFFQQIDSDFITVENDVDTLKTQAQAVYDSVINTGSIALDSSYTQQIVTGTYMTSGIVEAVQMSIDSGDSTSVTLQFYNGNPSITGVVIYEVAEYDVYASSLDDRNLWWMELSAVNTLWLKVTNNDLSNATTLNIRLRIKGD